MWGKIIEWTGGVKWEPPKKRRKIMEQNRATEIMAQGHA